MQRTKRRQLSRSILLTLLGLAVFVLPVLWLLSIGFRFYTVTTPSMGQTLPVGTFIAVQPASQYTTGDIISFTEHGRSYTHRIVGKDDEGFITRGDLNSVDDPWRISQGQITGSVRWSAWYLGWLAQGSVPLLIGCLIVWLVSLWPRKSQQWRWSVRLGGWGLVMSAVIFWLHPWVRMEMLSYVPAESGGIMAHVVSTGILPLDVVGTRVTTGQDVVVRVTNQLHDGRYLLVPRLALTWWQLALIVVIWLIPLYVASSMKFEVDENIQKIRESQWNRYQSRMKRTRTSLAVLSVILTCMLVFWQTSSSALTARVTNSTDTSGVRTWVTCQQAEQSVSNPVFVYAMNSTNKKENDLSTNGANGTYAVNALAGAGIGCQRDTPARSVQFDGATQCLSPPASAGVTNPNTFTMEAWFNTTTTSNGRIIGFGSAQTGAADSTYDRMIYIDAAGRVVFGVYPGTVKVIASAAGTNYANGAWHHVVASLSAAGMVLYVDGAKVAQNTAVTNGQSYAGYWKVGCGRLINWANGDGTTYNGPGFFTGSIQFAAVYYTTLTAQQVQEHYLAGAP